MSDKAALTCTNLYKEFNGNAAVQDLTFSVRKGIVFGLLGPNGSGKTSTIRMSLGIVPTDRGSIEILGSKDPLSVRHRIGYLPEERGLYPKMKVQEQLAFLGTIRGLSLEESNHRASSWLDRLALGERRASRTDELSKGMQQKVQFAAAVIHEPELVILDEPLSGLDPVNTQLVNELILEQRSRGATVILSTHRMEQVESLCDSICLIHQGRRVLLGELSEIKRSYGRNVVSLEYRGDPEQLRLLPGVNEVKTSGRLCRLFLAKDSDSQVLLQELLNRVQVISFRQEEPHIEDIYIEKVRGSAKPEAKGLEKESGE